MDILTLKSLKYQAKHGYYEEERTEGNTFEVDLVFFADLGEAGRTDDLGKTIDYQKAEALVRAVMEGPSVRLIETLAQKIGNKVFDAFGMLDKLEVSVRKLHPPLPANTEYSEVRMTWKK